MVTQFIELPDGTIVETRVERGMEIREGDEVSLKYIAGYIPLENKNVEIDGVRYDIPPGADRHQYLQKLFWSHELGVSVEEADRMIANRELVAKSEGELMTAEEEGIMARLLNKIPKFASFLRSDRSDLSETEQAPDSVFQSTEHQEINPGRSDTSSYPRYSPLEPKSVPQGKVEKQTSLPPDPPTVSTQETESREQLSPEHFNKAQQLIDQYGREEGLRRLRESDPEAARQFESEQREPKMNTEP